MTKIQHPLGGISAEEVASRAGQVIDFFEAQAGSYASGSLEVSTHADLEPLLEVPVDPWEFYDLAQAEGWGDGFPVLQPTPKRVARMLAVAGVLANSLVGRIPPANLHVTAQDVATNAVLAGCPDAAFHVVVTAVRAALQEKFNLLGILATTNPAGIGVLVSGPIAQDLGMNMRGNLYGPGNRLNATIGRGVRLACQNLGRAWPGAVDKSTQGQPSKYSLCFAENLQQSPWDSYHVDRGFDNSDSTVTVIAAEGPINIHGPASTTGDSLIQYICGSVAHAGHNNLYRSGDIFIVLCPEHANLLARDGFDRNRTRQEIFQKARLPARVLGEDEFAYIRSHWAPKEEIEYQTAALPIVREAAEIHVVVGGGPGKHSSWLPTFGLTYSSIAKL